MAFINWRDSTVYSYTKSYIGTLRTKKSYLYANTAALNTFATIYLSGELLFNNLRVS